MEKGVKLLLLKEKLSKKRFQQKVRAILCPKKSQFIASPIIL